MGRACATGELKGRLMHAINHLIYTQGQTNVRPSAMRNHALHLARRVSPPDRGPNGGALAEAGSGGVLQTCRSEARGICGEGAIRGHQGGLGVGVSCKYCGHRMRPGIAMGQTFSGSPDFPASAGGRQAEGWEDVNDASSARSAGIA